jgi:hypothetical protein
MISRAATNKPRLAEWPVLNLWRRGQEFCLIAAATTAISLPRHYTGGVVEWSIAPVLKTGEPQGSVGSNPTPSAIQNSHNE